MLRRYRELWYALILIVVATAVYAVGISRLGALPRPRGIWGHSFGLAGFALMLMTETLYSLRKRVASARWGPTSKWLRFHMVTGLVGPYMVLLHPALEFEGLAGAVALLTLIVVISGLFGRYLYSAIPRTMEGVEVEAAELERAIRDADVTLSRSAPAGLALAGAAQAVAFSAEAVPGASDWRQLEVALPREDSSAGLDPALRQSRRDLERLLRRRQRLQRQLAGLAAARRALALWRSIHVPMALVLFVMAFVHAGGAIYYSTLLR